MMKTQTQAGRTVRWMALIAVLVAALILVQVSLAQSEAPAAPTVATLTVGKSTTPAGGQDFWVTAASFQGSWGGRGTAPGKYRQPRDIETDAAGNFYISDHQGSRVQKLDANGNFVLQIGARGKGNGKVLRPNAIAVAGSTLYVADTDNNRIAVFNTNGNFIANWGAKGTGNGQFDRPHGVAVDSAGNLYVADTWNHRIQVFSSSGTYLRQWGTLGSAPGQMRYPAHIDFDAAGNLYVADSNNSRIQVFDSQGTFLRQFGSSGSGPGQMMMTVGIDVGADGFVYIGDTYNYRIQKLTTDGAYVGQWSQVAGGASISRPNGVLAVGNKVYGADLDAHRVQIFSQASFQLDDGQQQSASLPAGTYWVTEAPAAGWMLTGATCAAGNPSNIPGGVSVTLADGATVSCSFANQQ